MKTIEDAKKEGVKINEIYIADCLELMKQMPDNFIDVILTDPPYGYLNHKLDPKIDFKKISDEWARILKKDAFIVMFGRGTQLYRWASYLDELGFEFKEEIIWNKNHSTSPMLPIGRVHELIVIYSGGNKKIKKVRIPYEETTDANIIMNNFKSIIRAIKNKEKEELIKYIQNDFIKEFNRIHKKKHGITIRNVTQDASTVVNTLEKIRFGFVEKSIITVSREHFKMEHPTQKPIRLLERLLALVSDEGDLVFDPFLGSGATAVACKRLNRNYIGSEILDDYYKIADKRIKDVPEKLF
ncbi:MAG: DNA-methyltransferase [Ignavibacteria bacterium]